MSDFSFAKTAKYMIDDVVSYGYVRPEILERWQNLQSLIRLIAASEHDELCNGLDAHLAAAVTSYSPSIVSSVSARLSFGYVGGSCRYATALTCMQREYAEAFTKDTSGAAIEASLHTVHQQNSTVVASEPIVQEHVTNPAETKLDAKDEQTINTTTSSARQVVVKTEMRSTHQVAVCTTAAQPVAIRKNQHTITLLNEYRRQISEIADSINGECREEKNTAYDRCVAWQLLNVAFLKDIYKNEIGITSIRTVAQYWRNLIAEFPFRPKKGTTDFDLTSKKSIDLFNKVRSRPGIASVESHPWLQPSSRPGRLFTLPRPPCVHKLPLSASR